MKYFQTVFLDAAYEFIEGMSPSAQNKIYYNIRAAEQKNSSRLFKKLQDDIWEFRIRHGLSRIRLLAFWDKSATENTLVIATHGFIKKTDKVPGNEIERARNIRNRYFELKNKNYG